MNKTQTYLGDAVYCTRYEDNGIILSTNGPDSPDSSNTIILDQDVLDNLLMWLLAGSPDYTTGKKVSGIGHCPEFVGQLKRE